MAKIAVLGSGGFGTSLAVLAHRYGHEVTLWSKFPEEINSIRKYGENKKLLPGVPVDLSIKLTSDLGDLSSAELVIFAVPSFAVRQTAKDIRPSLPSHPVVANVGKGLEAHSHKRLSEVIKEELPDCSVVALSGPSHAEEIARGVPTTIVAASQDTRAAAYVQDTLMNATLRIYVNEDILGVELGGALKNIIALCAGILDGLGLGDNAKAALMTRGIAEISRLGVAMGARIETFSGLTGIGDLIVTCTSMHSRNRRAGILIGEGLTATEAVERVGTVEGYNVASTAWELACEKKVRMPILEQLVAILQDDLSPRQALDNLMGRPKRHEMEETWRPWE